MRQFHFNPSAPAPIVRCIVAGPKGAFNLRLILDSGSYTTQISRSVMNGLGIRYEDKTRDAYSIGVGGTREKGFEAILPRLFVLGRKFEATPICVFEMKYVEEDGTDGLLGWDLIRLFHFDMDGPKGLLKVF